MADIQQSVLNKLRKNKFILYLDLPKVMKGINTNSARTNELVNLNSLQFSIFGSVVPEISVPSIPLDVYGQTYNVTSQKRENYAPITVNFTVDNKLNNYWVLWKWLTILNDPKHSGMDSHFAQFTELGGNFPTNTPKSIYSIENKDTPSSVMSKMQKMTNDYTDYQTIMTVNILDEYNKKVANVNYYNAFITKLGSLQYSYRDPEELECNFTFAFNQLEIELVD